MYRIKTLMNGIRVISEHIPYVKSVSLGIWVRTGSRNENKNNNGVSHFIEHMLFKGTKNRTARDIADEIDSIGGQINAFTGKEYTCYYTKTLDTHLDIAVDILSDMLFNSRLDYNDINIERNVVLEEINMYEDTPEELVHDVLLETIWSQDSLGYPILGSKTSLCNIDRDVICKYMQDYYTPDNLVIAVAGNFEYDKMIELITNKFEGWNNKSNVKNQYIQAEFNSNCSIKRKDTEQTHLCIGFDGIELGNDDMFVLLVINNIFGGGMSSRLFQKIREEKGLAYSIYSYPSSYQKAGIFTIYSGMNPSQTGEVIKLIIEEVNLLKEHKLSSVELSKAKEQLKGNYILALESISSRMNSIGKIELLGLKHRTPEEVLSKIESIKAESVGNVIDRIFNFNKMSMALVGAIDDGLDLRNIAGL